MNVVEQAEVVVADEKGILADSKDGTRAPVYHRLAILERQEPVMKSCGLRLAGLKRTTL